MSCKSFAIKHVLLLSLAGLLVLCVAILLIAPDHLPYSELPKDLRIKHIASCVSGSCTLAGDKLQRAVDEVMRCQAGVGNLWLSRKDACLLHCEDSQETFI